ncbi:ribonuclease Z, mitochondrial isoform X1 [Drosophila mojavensis]|uniref:ribonuclease Z, mitochondrial isoform X1 n=1 Tax=Drosophila mojavensis TaxID=7230 RepID=UPI001CD14CFB|nr:ribonuclease Z, mitochondrial isoform X1 [Drosophila mojavensis]
MWLPMLKLQRIVPHGPLRSLTNHCIRMSSTVSTAAAEQTPPAKYERQPNVLRKKLSSVVPGSVNLQVLGAGANGAPSAVYLFTDQSRYLFNCGEGTQRLAHEHKTRLSRLEQIFVTRNTWTAVGGLPGLALTIQDAGVRNVGLHGPPHLDTMLQSMRRFVVLKNLQMQTIDSTLGVPFEDSILTVQPVVLRSEQQPLQPILSYICKLKPRPGALNLVKCVEAGVPPGPLLGQLKNGQDVTLPCGTVVHSVDVTEPAETALSFVFIDVPSLDYLESLKAQSEQYKQLANSELTEVALVVHFSPPELTAHAEYLDFMQTNFSAGTQHIYLNSHLNRFSGYAAAHRIQYQLHQLAPRFFPLLAEAAELQLSCPSNTLSHSLKKTKLDNDVEEQRENKLNESESVNAKEVKQQQVRQQQGFVSMSSFHLRPKKGLDRTLESKLTPEEYIKETHAVPGFSELLTQLQSETAETLKIESKSYPRIIFLGTGSCIPNKTRNVSSILIQTAAEAFMLFDCGEGTHGQIVRLFGRERAREVMLQLQAVYVSHLHADHHIGLIALLRERQRLEPTSPLLLLAPRQIEPWLNFYNRQIEPIADAYTLMGNGELLEQPLAGERVEQLGIASIATCLVRHCPHAFGISLTLQAQHEGEPIKLTYSGDTMPCADLVELGRNSTVLIHEATMEDDLEEEARIKTHSTISQAIQQGRDMQAKHTILTHFSQRYAKCPRLPSTEDMQHVAIAFDNMQVTVEDLQHYHKLYPALLAMYAEYTEELEQRAVKRELKQERKRKLAQT